MEGVRQAKWGMENTLKSAIPKDKDICIEHNKENTRLHCLGLGIQLRSNVLA